MPTAVDTSIDRSGISPAIDAFSTFAIIYTPGPRWIPGRPVQDQDLGAHRKYIENLYHERRVLFGGRFLDRGGGLMLICAADQGEAERLLSADPAITNRILEGEVRPWLTVFDRSQPARTNADAARRLFEAVERRDRSGVVAIYDENIVIHEAPSLPYGGEYHGHEGAMRHGNGFRATWDRFQPENKRGLEPTIIAEDDRVAVLWQHKAKNPATGRDLNLPAVSVYQFRAGKIVESRMFHFDTAALHNFLNESCRGN